MNLYSKARKHIDMDRVKELRQKKIKEEKIAKLIQEQEKICAELKCIEAKESKHCDWKKELEEGMTTSGMGMINLDGEGDVNLVDLSNEIPDSQVSSATNNGGTYTFPAVRQEIETASSISFIPIDLSKVDTLVFNFTAGNIDHFHFDVIRPNLTNSIYSLSVSSGSKVITLRQADRVRGARLVWLVSKNEGDPVGTNRISGIALQRRRPMNVFVDLDDPEANSFIRDGKQDKKSPKEKKKLLEKQLKAAREYLKKMFGEGMPNGAIEIADYVLQQSFAEIAGTNYDLYNYMIKRYGLPAAEWKKNNPTKPDASNPFLPKGSYVPKASAVPPTEIAAKYPKPDPFDKLLKDIDDADKKLKNQPPGTRPGKGRGMGDRWEGPIVKGKGKTVVAHHEPEGKVIKEKKSFKDITKKIPGYYDDKPSPLGFPLEEPPKMVNGYHPDLVDGKKVANRFNRLDPQSAKAMPKTGNPHIDKKVRAAAKKPK